MGPGDDGRAVLVRRGDGRRCRTGSGEGSRRTFFAYGGDWGDNPNDGAFVADGIVTADRGHTGKAAEVKRIYQAVHATTGGRPDARAVTLTNEYLFTNLREFDGRWTLVARRKGSPARQADPRPAGRRPPVQQGHHRARRACPPDPAPGAEYFLELSFTTKESTKWAKAGFEVARQQLPVDAGSPAVTPVPLASVPVLSHEDGDASGHRQGQRSFSVTVDKTSGTITSYKAGGTRLISSGPAPNFWRAPTDNDHGNGQHTRNETWRDAGTNRTVTVSPSGPCATGPSRSRSPARCPTTTESTYTTTYTVFGNGEIKVDNTLHPGARVHCRTSRRSAPCCSCPRRLDRLHYYGRGPEENHWDRNNGTDVGLYSGTVAGQWTGYLRPQENGNKTDVRWVALTDRRRRRPAGLGRTASGGQRLALHPGGPVRRGPPRLPAHPARRRSSSGVNHRQMGVGGDNSWGAHTHDEYKLFANRDYSYSYRLRPLTDVDEAMAASRRPTATE